MAERPGFEPGMEFNPHTRLAGVRLQPLGHRSTIEGHAAWEKHFRQSGLAKINWP